MSISNGFHFHDPTKPMLLIPALRPHERPYFAFRTRLAQHNYAVAQMRQRSIPVQLADHYTRAGQAKEATP